MTWKFDKLIADIYLDHVRQHIPNYDQVIEKSVSCCVDILRTNDSILDFGCATGNTLEKLKSQGFTDIYGVDASQDMLDKCQTPAQYILGNDIPDMKFNAVIANWVLHFNENKEILIEKIYNSLKDDGVFILSEKLKQSDFVRKKYYHWKSSRGVTDEEIKNKEHSLKGKMFLDSLDWYFEKLYSSGFRSAEIIDGSWGFVTLLARK